MRHLSLILSLSACVAADPTPADGEPVQATLTNQGGGREGHTPRGFEGMGTGPFVGDDLNSGFPPGDGVQLFLSFSLDDLAPGEVTVATLTATDPGTVGTPFVDLGDLVAVEVVYDRFGADLWDLEPVEGGGSCVLAKAADDPFRCDLTEVVQHAVEGGRRFAQIRLRHDRAGDGDGMQDLTVFHPAATNDNAEGLFEIAVTVVSPAK